MKELLKIFFLWRVWLIFALLVAIAFIPIRSNQAFTTILQDYQVSGLLKQEWVYPWANFDGVHYLNIAYRGYVNEGRFLPLYPYLIRFISFPFTLIFGNSISIYFWVSKLFQFLVGYLSLVYMYKLFLLDYPSRFSKKTIFLFLSFPLTFFLGLVYSEALFILFSVLSLYCARKKQWIFAIITAMLLSVTRLSGVLIVFPLAIELFLQNKSWFNFNLLKKLLPLILVPLPLLFYAYFNYHTWGDWLYFVNAHAALGNSRTVSGLVFPLVTVYRYLKILLTVSPQLYEFWIAVLELLSLVFAGVFIILGYLKRLRISYQVYSVVMIALPLLSGTLTGLPRYILPLFPLFLVQSLVLDKHPKRYKLVVVISLLLQAVLFGLFARSYYIS